MASAHDRARAHQRQRRARAGVADAVDQLHPRRGIATLLRGARVARLRQASATSAGGIVIRFTDGTPELVVGKRRRERDGVTWTLPKGTPEADETTEQTAVREVREETGLEVSIVRAFDFIEYWFVTGRTRIHKIVHYFLMVPTGGDLAGHDHEFAEVRWIAFGEASSLLTFETERALVARAAAAATDGTFPVTA
jgi:8-oxo-dGTP pyrophosphatase MutT (NUDIX family)